MKHILIILSIVLLVGCLGGGAITEEPDAAKVVILAENSWGHSVYRIENRGAVCYMWTYGAVGGIDCLPLEAVREYYP